MAPQERAIAFGAKHMTLIYPVDSNKAHPAPLSPACKSSIKRAPQKPLIPMRHTLSELTGLGERIIVHGHVLERMAAACPTRCSKSGRRMPAAATFTSA